MVITLALATVFVFLARFIDRSNKIYSTLHLINEFHATIKLIRKHINKITLTKSNNLLSSKKI